MAALIRGDCDRLHIFLNGGIDDLLHGAVVPEMNDLDTGGLQHPSHDIDRGVMAVEKRGGGHEPDFVRGLIDRLGGDGYGAHGLLGEYVRLGAIGSF